MWSIIELKKMLSLQQDSIGWFLAVIAVWGISLRPLLYLACMARLAVLEGTISMMCLTKNRHHYLQDPFNVFIRSQCQLFTPFIGILTLLEHWGSLKYDEG